MRTGILSVIILFLTATAARCGAIEDAIKSIEGFSEQRTRLLETVKTEEAGKFGKERSKEKQKAEEELRTLRWSDEPGERRYRTTRKIVEDFTKEELRALSSLAASEPPSKKAAIENIIESLSRIKEDVLQKLDESFREEKEKMKSLRKKEPPPVPSVDTSPFEEQGGKGIWER